MNFFPKVRSHNFAEGDSLASWLQAHAETLAKYTERTAEELAIAPPEVLLAVIKDLLSGIETLEAGQQSDAAAAAGIETFSSRGKPNVYDRVRAQVRDEEAAKQRRTGKSLEEKLGMPRR